MLPIRAHIAGLTVKVELTPDGAQWVEAEVAAGRFPTPEDAVRYAIIHAKMSELRGALQAAEAKGGAFASDDVRRFARAHLDRTTPRPASDH
jgi:Arc/MetJ-type ribon-helix-helix transcriptional regulator